MKKKTFEISQFTNNQNGCLFESLLSFQRKILIIGAVCTLVVAQYPQPT